MVKGFFFLFLYRVIPHDICELTRVLFCPSLWAGEVFRAIMRFFCSVVFVFRRSGGPRVRSMNRVLRCVYRSVCASLWSWWRLWKNVVEKVSRDIFHSIARARSCVRACVCVRAPTPCAHVFLPSFFVFLFLDDFACWFLRGVLRLESQLDAPVLPYYISAFSPGTCILEYMYIRTVFGFFVPPRPGGR